MGDHLFKAALNGRVSTEHDEDFKELELSNGKSDLFLVTMDSSELDDEQYLEWLDAEFGEEETRD